MESYKKSELKNNEYEYQYDYNFGINDLYDKTIQEQYERKVDTLLDGILSNSIKIKK